MCSPQFRRTPTATPPSIVPHTIARTAAALLPGCPRTGAPVAPPQECRQQEHDNRNRDIESLHALFQFLPVASEEIADAGDDRHPQRRPQKIDEKKSLPRHAENSRHRAGNDPHSKNESRKENCQRAVALEKTFSAIEGRFLNLKNGLVPRQQRPPTVVTQCKSKVI